jgi:TolB-like protein/DNA-binding winged helix-turn-helix (wHTH) protein/Flp pilus assembly protein TadD
LATHDSLRRSFVRFDTFSVDLSSAELFRSGMRVPIQGQPLQVLRVLLEAEGNVVTREQLRAAVWPQDTFVDFEHGVNTAVKKLRQALDDSAECPRFVETLPKIGYRFIVPVEWVADEIRNDPPPPIGPIAPGSTSVRPFAATASPQLTENTVVGNAASEVVLTRLGSRKRFMMLSAIAGLLLILASVVYLRRSYPAPTSATQKRVMLAVLPFQNMSNDPGQEYFSDGLTEETITDLGQLSPEHLGVIARTSAMTYKHTDKSISQIGRELGVDYVLEGSVRREGGQARISAQLIRTSDQTHLWAQNYQRDLHDLLQIENELGTAIARQVQGNLTPQQQVDLSKMRPVNPDAYDLYLKGRFYWNQNNRDAMKESVGYFQQAIAKDPDFALAYVGLANAYNKGTFWGAYSPQESRPKAKAAATKALALDPSLAEAHTILGMEKSFYEFDFPGAQKEFLKAIELNPNYAYAHLWYSACYLAPMGRMPEAIAENKKALELDPLSMTINDIMAMTYMSAGDYENSYRQFQHTIAMDPNSVIDHAGLSFLLKITGRYEEGIEENEKKELLFGSSAEDVATRATMFRQALKKGGEKGMWQKELELKKPWDESPDIIASLYALTGDKDRAFEWLDKAYAERDMGIIGLKVDPAFTNLHGDPRFAALLRRMGLPE